jgi:hypothetical protein
LIFKRLDDAAGMADCGVPTIEFNCGFSFGLEKPASIKKGK